MCVTRTDAVSAYHLSSGCQFFATLCMARGYVPRKIGMSIVISRFLPVSGIRPSRFRTNRCSRVTIFPSLTMDGFGRPARRCSVAVSRYSSVAIFFGRCEVMAAMMTSLRRRLRFSLAFVPTRCGSMSRRRSSYAWFSLRYSNRASCRISET